MSEIKENDKIDKINERKTKTKKKRKEKKYIDKKKVGNSYSERVRAIWFCFAFKLGFLQLICNTPLIFKSNLELALSIILKKENYTS